MTSTDLMLSSEQTSFNEQQTRALEQFGIINVPPAELEVFFHHSKRCGLDPFSKQIYLIPRYNSKLKRDVWTPQTSIDGLRLIADRTGKYAGSESSTHSVGGILISVTVTVRKVVAGVIGEFTATALFKEYAQKYPDGNLSGLWKTMPTTLLTKCAEAKALRMAFPQDMFGMYTDDEMPQTDIGTNTVEAIEVDSLVSSENVERFKDKCAKAGFAWEKIFELAEVQIEGLRESQLPTLNEAFNVAKLVPADYAANGVTVIDTPIIEATAHPVEKPSQPIAERREPTPRAAPPTKETPITAGQIRMLQALCRGKEWDDTKRHEEASTSSGRIIGSFTELTSKEASDFIGHVKALGSDE